MTPSKRAFDIGFSLFGLLLFALPALVIMVLLFVCQGRPIFYRSERMITPDQGFQLWKFRTMTCLPTDSGVSGGDKTGRITPLGRRLRRLRLDELPQLWNVLCGDMSMVGPRPPLRAYVDRFPTLYGQVLRCRPGLSGLATVVFHRHEAMLLAQCINAQDTDAIYARRCIPRKARLDLIYQRKQTFLLDLAVLAKTFFHFFSKA